MMEAKEEDVDEMLNLMQEDMEEEEVDYISNLMEDQVEEEEVDDMQELVEVELEEEVDGHPSQTINRWMHQKYFASI